MKKILLVTLLVFSSFPCSSRATNIEEEINYIQPVIIPPVFDTNLKQNVQKCQSTHSWHVSTQEQLKLIRDNIAKKQKSKIPNIAKFRIAVKYVEDKEEKCADFSSYLFLSRGEPAEKLNKHVREQVKSLGLTPVTMDSNFISYNEIERDYHYRKQMIDFFGLKLRERTEQQKRQVEYTKHSIANSFESILDKSEDTKLKNSAKQKGTEVAEHIDKCLAIMSGFDDESNEKARVLFSGKTADEEFGEFNKDFYDSEQVIRQFLLGMGFAAQENEPLKPSAKKSSSQKPQESDEEKFKREFEQGILEINGIVKDLKRPTKLSNLDITDFNQINVKRRKLIELDSLLLSANERLQNVQKSEEEFQKSPYYAFQVWNALRSNGKTLENIEYVRLDIASFLHMCNMCNITYAHVIKNKILLNSILNGIRGNNVGGNEDQQKEALQKLNLIVLVSGIENTDKPSINNKS